MVAFGSISAKPHGLRSALVLTAIAMTVAACGSSASSSGAPTSSASYSRGQYAVAITQCGIDRGLIPKKYWAADAAAHHWLVDGHIVDNSSFAQWWNANTGVVTIAGKTLSAWQTQAYSQQHVPEQICGSTAMPTPVAS